MWKCENYITDISNCRIDHHYSLIIYYSSFSHQHISTFTHFALCDKTCSVLKSFNHS
jgi:hypothetical protein